MTVPLKLLINLVTESHNILPVFLSVGRVGGFVCKTDMIYMSTHRPALFVQPTNQKRKTNNKKKKKQKNNGLFLFDKDQKAAGIFNDLIFCTQTLVTSLGVLHKIPLRLWRLASEIACKELFYISVRIRAPLSELPKT